jgi:uncharacterized sulfatase
MKWLWKFLLLAGMTMGAVIGAETPPHIVLFLADDMGWEDAQTPHLKRLSRDGITFSHAFVASPSCAPSRAALLTGMSCARNGAMFNHSRPRAEVKKWPAYFKEAGYDTAAIGKTAHYGQVKEYGFDHFSHFTYHEDTCIDAACAWLQQRSSPRPLCLIVGTNWPHVPWPAEGATGSALPSHLIDTQEIRAAHARYQAAVMKADADVGRVYETVRRTLGANVLFLFTSDHGAQLPFGKWNCYDHGIRTPLIAVWPERIKAGEISPAMVSWIDVLPTCLDAAGVPPPQDLDGRSFLPVLQGKTAAHRERIFTSHSGDGEMNEYPMRAVRSWDWKYIRNLAPERRHHTHIDKATPAEYWESWVKRAEIDPAAKAIVERYHQRPAEELYDLTADPRELSNLAGEAAHAEVLSRLRGELDEWMRRQGDTGLETEKLVKPKPVKKN